MSEESISPSLLSEDASGDSLVSGIASELKALMASSSKEEAELFMDLIGNDNTAEFKSKMRKLHDTAKKKDSNQVKDIPRMSVHKELENRVVREVLHYFELDSQTKRAEAFEIEKKLTGHIESSQISDNEARELSCSDNPYTRMMVASHGHCAKELSNDPVSYIRLEVLKKTGVYSEHYREKETDLTVIREFVRQGIDNDFYRTFNEDTRYMVEVQEAADEIIEAIESGCEEAYQNFTKKLARHPEEQQYFLEVQMHIDIVMQDCRSF